MEPEGSLLYPQEPAICPYSEPDKSRPCPPSRVLKIHFNITFTPGSSKWSLSLRVLHQNPVCTSPRLQSATCPAYVILIYFITWIIFGQQYRSLSSSLCSLLHSPVTSSLLGPNIILSTLVSNTLSLHPFLNVSDQVPHSYKTKGRIIVLYILNFKFFYSKFEDKRFCNKW